MREQKKHRSFDYDFHNRLKKVTDGGLTTGFRVRRQRQFTEPVRRPINKVEYTYDRLNRKTAHIQHKSTGGALITQFTIYDAEGNLTRMVDPKGAAFTYIYDVLNRRTDAFNPTTGSPYYETTHVQTVYDENNNIKRVTETKSGGAGSLTDTTINTYDNFDRLVDSTQRGLTIDYTYDDNGNRTRVSTPAGTTTYTYDVRNRLETAATDSGTTTYTYYRDGKKDTVAYPNNTMADYDYTAANRISNEI